MLLFSNLAAQTTISQRGHRRRKRLSQTIRAARRLALAAALFALAPLVNQAYGQTLYWDTNGATAGSGNQGGTWNTTTANWTTSAAGTLATTTWIDGSAVVFSAGSDATNAAKTITLSQLVNTNSILLQGTNPNINLASGTINIQNGVFNTAAAGSSNTLTWSSQITGSGGLTINANGDTSASGGAVPGHLHLSSATSTFTGGATITSGVVRADSNFGDASNAITLNGGGLVDTNQNINFTRNIIVGASGGVYRAYGTVTSGQISGAITGAGVLRKTDTGTVRLSGNGSAFTGEINVQSGHVNVSTADWSNTSFRNEDGNGLGFLTGTNQYNIGSYTGDRDVFIEAGVTLNVVSGNFSVTNGTTINNFWVQGNGSLTSSSGTLTANWGTTSYDTATDRAIRVTIKDHGGSATALSLVKSGVGGLILTTANTYTGGTTINAGRISAQNASALGTGLVTVNSGAQAYLTAASTYANNFSIAGIGSTESAGNLGAIRLENNTVVSGAVNLAGASRITVLTSTSTGTITGVISGSSSLEKTGAGTLGLSARNTFTGGTTVSAGTLSLNGGGGTGGTIRGVVTVNAGATLRLNAGDVTGYATDSTRLSTINLNGTGVTPGSIGAMHVSTIANQTLGSATLNLNGASVTGIVNSNLDFFGGSSAINSLASATTSTISGVKLNLRQSGGLTINVADGTAANDLEISSVISNATGFSNNNLTKAGAGTLVLSGNNTYSTSTIVNAGILRITGTNVAPITVNRGATFNGASFGSTSGLLTMNAGAILAFDANGAFTSNGVNFAGATTLAHTQSLTVGNSYDVLNYGAGSVANLGNLTGLRGTLTDDTVNKKIILTFGGVGLRTWNATSGTWDVLSTNNFAEGDLKFASGDTVAFNNPSANSVVNLVGSLMPTSISVANTNAYTFSGTGSLAGASSLTKSGTGTLTLSNTTANTYTGGTTIQGGVLSLGTGGTGADTSTASALGTGTVAIESGATLRLWIQNSNTFSIANNLSINGGTLLGEDGIYNMTGAVAVGASGATFQANWSGKTLTLSNTISGAGPVTISNGPSSTAGTVIFSGVNTYTGNTAITSGTLEIGGAGQLNSGAYAGTISNAGTLRFNSSANQSLSGVISGTGSLVKNGTGTLTLNAANTYSGGTTVNTGTLVVGNTGATNGRVTLNGGNVNIANGVTYNVDGGLTFASNTNAILGTVSGTATLRGFDVNSADVIVNTGVNATIASTVTTATNTYGIRYDVNGTGTLTYGGAITGNGSAGSAVNAGTMIQGDSTAIWKRGTGDLILTGVSTFTAGSGNAVTSVQDGRVILSGGNDRFPTNSAVYLGATNNTSGKLVLNGISQTITGLTNIGTGAGNAVVGGNAVLSTLTIDNSKNYTFGGRIGGTGANENNIALVKSGSGVLTLSGANTYTGNTLVSGGTLDVTGSIAAGSTITIGTAGRLTGTGTIGGNVIVTGNGVVALTGAGNILGTLGVSGGTWTNSGSVSGAITSSSNSFTIDNGATITAGGGLNVIGGTLAGTGTFNGDVSYTSSDSSDFGGVIAGTNKSLTMNAPNATFTLRGANTYTGATTINGGTLEVIGSTSSASAVSVGTAGALAGSGTIGGDVTLTGNGVIALTGAGNIGGSLSVTGGNWNGTGSVTGVVNSSSDTFTIGSGANLTTTGGLNVGGGSLAGTGTITGSVNYESNLNSVFGGTIAGTGSTLTVDAAGSKLTLSGSSTYTGGTNVLAGTLLVNNTTGSGTGTGDVTVASGATLGGTGSIAGNVTVEGQLSPGASIESLDIGGDLVFAANSTLLYELDSLNLNGDLLNAAGDLLIGSNVTLNLQELASGSLALNSKLTMISYAGTWDNSTFSGFGDDSTFQLGTNNWRINYNDVLGGSNFSGGNYSKFVTLTVVAVPEPSSLLLGLAGGIAVLQQVRRRRKKATPAPAQSTT